MAGTETSQRGFANTDEPLREQAARLAEDRARLGLDGLVGGLAAVIAGVEPENLVAAARELVATTGYAFDSAFEAASVQVGGPEEGLHQAFTTTPPNTLLVTEYIERYAGFDGFFTRGNVAQLTEATARQ